MRRPELIADGALVGGHLIHAADSHSVKIYNPASRELLHEVPDCGRAEAARAVDAAAKAFQSWRATTAKHRANLLKAWFAKLLEHQDDLARLISLEQATE